MSKNSNTVMMRKAAFIAMALGSILSPGMGKSAPTHQMSSNQANSDAVAPNQTHKVSKQKIPLSSGASRSKVSYKRGDLNQRQYRKKVRQNPHILRSKKFRGKN